MNILRGKLGKKNIKKISEEFEKNNLKKKRKKGEKRFIIFVGVPGSGKSTISKSLEESSSFIKVSTDEIKRFLIQKKISFNLKDLFSIQKIVFERLMDEKRDIISDSNTDTEEYRRDLRKFLNKRGYKYLVIYLPLKREDSLKRVMRRKNLKNSKKVFKKIEKSFRDLEIPEECIILDTDKSKKNFINEVNSFNFYEDFFQSI